MAPRGRHWAYAGVAAAMVLALGATSCGSGGGALAEMPFAMAHVGRMGVTATAAVSARDAWMLYRTPGGTWPDVLRWDGTTVQLVDLPDDAQANSIAPIGPGQAIVGGVQVLQLGGAQPEDVSAQLSGAVTFRVAGRGDGTVYATGFSVLLRRRPGEAMFTQLAGPPGGLKELVVAGDDRLLGVGDGNGTSVDVIYAFDGTAWQEAGRTRTGRQLAAASPTDVWALPLSTGRDGAPLQAQVWNGTEWALVPIAVSATPRNGVAPTTTVLGVVALGGGRAGVAVTRRFATTPPYDEIVWVTGDRSGLASESVVRVYCQTQGCTDGGDFAGAPARAQDGTLFVGPYYGSVAQ